MEQSTAFSQLPEIVEEESASSSDTEKVYVAVGKSVEKGVGLIQWSLGKFVGREVCLLHVHQPSSTIPTPLGKLPASQANGVVLSAYRKEEEEKTRKLLQNYLSACGKKVKASFIMVVADQIPLGIVDAVKKYGVKKLVMGTEPNNCMKVRRNSSKAYYVAEKTSTSCEIWFIHKGKHLWTREASKSVNSLQEYNQTEFSAAGDLRSNSSRYTNKKLLYPPECLRSHSTRIMIDRGISKLLQGEKVQMQVDSSPLLYASQSGVSEHSLKSSGSSSLEYSFSERMGSSDSGYKAEDENLCNMLFELKIEAEGSHKNLLEEQQKRERLEIKAMEAINRVKVLESAFEYEVKIKKEAKNALRITMMEREKLFEEREEITHELHKIMTRIALLDGQTQEANHRRQEATKELNLIEASITTLWQEKQRIWRQKMEAENWLERWRNRGVASPATCNGLLGFVEENPGLAEFSLSDLQTATCNFSESFKIGEGGYGCVYKGEIMGRTVAVKKLHPHTMQGQLEFQQEVKVLGKLKHPYLVTLLGYCSEAWSLVYEYLPNGSLQDFLSWRKNYCPLTWKIRARIIAEIASALCFLHSSRPEMIVHGDLKPDNILLDSEMVCKISDFGICGLVHEEVLDRPSFRQSTEPKGSFSYADPEFHRVGILTSKSDVYSFGLIVLQLLTGRSPLGLASDVRKAISSDELTSILDYSAGEWPTFAARKLADLGLQFCELNSRNRPELTPALVRELEQLHMSEERPIPSFFLCPILQEIMHDPQVAADGFTYEGEALRGWLENGRETSPMTNLKLSHLHLTPNHALRLAIQDWLCKS